MTQADIMSLFKDRLMADINSAELGLSMRGSGATTILSSSLTWHQLRTRGWTGMFLFIADYYETGGIWLSVGEIYAGNMPFEIDGVLLSRELGVGSEPHHIHLLVKGQQSDRIKKKWAKKLSQVLGCEVSLAWLGKSTI